MMITVTHRASNIFAAIGNRLTGSADKAVLTTAEMIRDRAKQLVHVRTGATRDSIAVDGIVAGLRESQANVVVTTYYAPFLEFGTVHAPAYPFMRPAAEEVTAQLAQITTQAFIW